MKATLLMITIALMITACKEEKAPPVVVAPAPIEAPVTVATCTNEGAKISCHVAIGGCENFKDQTELLAVIESSGFNNAVSLNGTMIHSGFGPAVSCKNK